MGTRQTSINCYNQIEAQGLLSKLRLRTLNALLNSSPCTAGELQSYIEHNKIQVKHAWKLLSQLRDLGVVYEKSERKCKITGRLVIEWDLTDKLPIKPTKILTEKDKRVNEVIFLLREIWKNKIGASNQDWINLADLIKKI